MDLQQVKATSDQFYMNTYGERQPVLLTHGKGCTLYGEDGKAYTDFLAGIAVCALGYDHPALNEAIKGQTEKLIHCSNYFYTAEQAELAKLLVENTCADRMFFGNSGAEANEGAIKLAREYFYAQGIDRYEIISTINSFHGRTIATLAATGQEKYRKPFGPMPAGFINVPYKDIDAVKAAITEHTAAVMVEPIQGEGGVIEGGEEYLKALRALCDEHGILLIFDEIQCGMGRTGCLYAHQAYGVEPDIFTSAKALAGGLPIGALMAKAHCCAFKPGDHGTTFGGNPFSCAAGIAVMKEMLKEGFLAGVKEKGAYLKELLTGLKAAFPEKIKEVRGLGLMQGMELIAELPVKELQAKLLDAGFITATAGGNTLRLVPPLVISKKEMDALSCAISTILTDWEISK
ncbi:MAG: aspartate aminotransferase family protein [Clostridia bacterium]|nr:aspartate aminotransferase family protein [Clostridia bacterium]